MFSQNPKEKVTPLEGFPQSAPGAPCPAVVATENSLAVLFYLHSVDPKWDGTSVRIVDINSVGEPSAIVVFNGPTVHSFGPPNDEAFSGHRLASIGLKPYGAFEVLNSSWIQELEKMNSVHPYHDREHFLADKRHFILTFHDSTFECIAQGYRVEYPVGTIQQILQAHVASLNA